MQLPDEVVGFRVAGAPRTITGETIFEYMNGAGEMYLAYRFERLEVFEYSSADQGEILVELYWMEHPDDAYGLLSDDWSGEALELGKLTAASRRALYGAGYLRLAWDRLYVRILADDENEASRAAVEELGRACVIEGGHAAAPTLIGRLPALVAAGDQIFELRDAGARFLRSYLSINVAYYLASDDILGLGPEVEAVLAEYRPRGGDHTSSVRLLMIHYGDEAARVAGQQTFEGVYLAEPLERRESGGATLTRIEAGWVATHGAGRDLVLVFDAPGAAAAEALVATAAAGMTGGAADP